MFFCSVFTFGLDINGRCNVLHRFLRISMLFSFTFFSTTRRVQSFCLFSALCNKREQFKVFFMRFCFFHVCLFLGI